MTYAMNWLPPLSRESALEGGGMERDEAWCLDAFVLIAVIALVNWSQLPQYF